MLEQVVAAFEQQDYRTAKKLLKQLVKESPEEPWVQFYVGRLYEVSERYEDAEKIYRRLLRDATNTKIVNAARQGLQRVSEIEQQKRQQALTQAKANASELGVLILEPLTNELKTPAAQKLAKIMEIDPYNARLLLPSRSWRFFRSGAIGELEYYGQQLLNSQIPCFWAKLNEIEQINIFQVDYFLETIPKVTVICRNQANQLGSLSFDWSEVKTRVQGLLPIFEQVVDIGLRGQLQRKTQTQDYSQFCDLHLPDRRTILRFYDNGYDFQKGVEIAPQATINTIRINWNNLIDLINQQLPNVKVWSDFTTFAETILDQTEMLSQIQPHIRLFRREKSNWDPAFHLYSGLVFWKKVTSDEL